MYNLSCLVLRGSGATILVKSVGTLEHLKTLTLSTTPPPHLHPVQC